MKNVIGMRGCKEPIPELFQGSNVFVLEDGPPGQTAEYIAGWKFGYGLGEGFDSDCGGVVVVK